VARSRVAGFFRRLGYAQFESLIAGLAVATSLIGLFQPARLATEPLDLVLPHWAAVVFLAGYLLSGLCLLVGLGAARADVEAAGLVIIAASQVARVVASTALLGAARTEVAITFAGLVVWACQSRIRQLVRAGRVEGGGGVG
jgi:hypothetical protein